MAPIRPGGPELLIASDLHDPNHVDSDSKRRPRNTRCRNKRFQSTPWSTSVPLPCQSWAVPDFTSNNSIRFVTSRNWRLGFVKLTDFVVAGPKATVQRLPNLSAHILLFCYRTTKVWLLYIHTVYYSFLRSNSCWTVCIDLNETFKSAECLLQHRTVLWTKTA